MFSRSRVAIVRDDEAVEGGGESCSRRSRYVCCVKWAKPSYPAFGRSSFESAAPTIPPLPTQHQGDPANTKEISYKRWEASWQMAHNVIFSARCAISLALELQPSMVTSPIALPPSLGFAAGSHRQNIIHQIH